MEIDARIESVSAGGAKKRVVKASSLGRVREAPTP
jgi:hypothetical protein